MAVSTLMGLLLTISRTMASSQFVIIEQKKSYQQASDYCATVYGTTLATIRNDYDARDLLELKQDLGGDHTWVGLTMNSGEWKWDSGFECDGDCLNLKWWDNGQPDKATTTCTVIHGSRNEIDELLHDVACTRNDIKDFACDVPVMGKRMAAVEAGLSSVNAVESKMGAVESDVDVLETEMDTVQSDVDSVESRLLSLERLMESIDRAFDRHSDRNCAEHIDGGGWKLVRHSYDKWSDANDNLVGTAEYGTVSGPTSDNEFAIAFDAADDTEFLFSNGDCDRWLITTFDQFGYQKGSLYDATILKSCISDTPYTAKWYNRAGRTEDPWISFKDHGADSKSTILYGENDWQGPNIKNAHGQFVNVWMREKSNGEVTLTFGDYVLYALVLLNLVVLLGLFAFCMVRRVPMDMAKVQYGRVYETEMDKL